MYQHADYYSSPRASWSDAFSFADICSQTKILDKELRGGVLSVNNVAVLRYHENWIFIYYVHLFWKDAVTALQPSYTGLRPVEVEEKSENSNTEK